MKLGQIRVVAGTLAIGLSGLALSGCMGPTYGTGQTSGEQLVSDLDGMLSLGATKKGEPINYGPRAELVRPKNTSVLPQPQEATNAANNPNWPESPEVRSARLKAQADARDKGDGAVSADVLLASRENATPEQIAANSRPRAPVSDNASTTLSPEEMKGGSAAFRQKLKENQGGNPTQRKYLSEPPIAYRAPAASAPVGDPGIDEDVKEAKLKSKDGSLTDKLKALLPF